jgi:hypothetical protein
LRSKPFEKKDFTIPVEYPLFNQCDEKWGEDSMLSLNKTLMFATLQI